MTTTAMPITIVEMADDFKQAILDGYRADPRWTKVIDLLRAENDRAEQDRAALPYELDDRGLLRGCSPLLSNQK
jgi:hypothetical protein